LGWIITAARGGCFEQLCRAPHDMLVWDPHSGAVSLSHRLPATTSSSIVQLNVHQVRAKKASFGGLVVIIIIIII
jgi:hypothetical protein